MYRVVIVDDEEPVLDSYAFMLAGGDEGFSLVGKARTGFEAIKLIHEQKPDLVFMDINMPGIDGLETISQVHERFPSTLFVLSTAYERFDLARRAIPLGVFAYLVKPVSRKVFTETLASARSALDRRRVATPRLDADRGARDFLRDVALRRADAPTWALYRESLALESDFCLAFFALIDSDDPSRFAAFDERLSLRYRFVRGDYLGLGLYAVLGDVDRDECAQVVSEILAATVPPSVLSFVGIGSKRSGPDLCLSCEEALAEIRQRKNRSAAEIRERLGLIQLRRELGMAESDRLRARFDAWWKDAFSSCAFDEAKAKMVACFTLLVDDCTGCYSAHPESPPPFVPATEIQAIDSVESWAVWSSAAFDRLLELSERRRSGRFPVPLIRALEFIDERYASSLQLADVATAAQVSPAYLSRLFGEQMGASFVDYLTELRIERAERLIREGGQSIKEIAFAVGYQDPNYFSKIFRKAVGMSPSMYAEKERYENGEKSPPDSN